MKITDNDDSSRYWGYEILRDPKPETGDFDARRQAHADAKAKRQIVKTAGYKPSQYGMKSKAAAVRQAKALESRFPDIEFHVFKHDYLF